VNSEKKAAEMMEARVGQKEKSFASVDERIVVSAGFAVGGSCFLALRRGRLKVGRACKPQRLIHRQDTAWGTSGQLVGGTVWVQVAGFFPRKMECVEL